jgi:hypothetical protein
MQRGASHTGQGHHEICDRRRAAWRGLIRMLVKPRPGARAESRLHPSQRRGATEGQLHASHVAADVLVGVPRTAGSGADLCHSDDWREANEGLDHPARSPQASEFADGHHTVPPYLPAERDQRKPAPRRSRRHPCPVASGSVGRAQGALLSAAAASPAETRHDAIHADQADQLENRRRIVGLTKAYQAGLGSADGSSRSTNRSDSLVSASAFSRT